MTAKILTGIRMSNFWDSIVAFAHSRTEKALDFLQHRARRTLQFVLIVCILSSLFSCLFLGSVSLGVIEVGAGTPQPPAARSGDDVTATYGAELFYLQLTAVANER